MTNGKGTGTGEGRSPAPPKMPPLRRAERDALRASIERWGIIQPVVYDKSTDELLDGQHRIDIATELGIDYDYKYVTCKSDEERDALRIELNTARRQLPDEQWKLMVDHLRRAGYSDRVVAKAVFGKDVTGANVKRVQRHKTPDLDGGTNVPRSKVLAEDGTQQQRRKAPELTDDRVLRLIGASRRGLTDAQLVADQGFGVSERDIRRARKRMSDEGKIEAAGKEAGGGTIWRLRNAALPISRAQASKVPPPPPRTAIQKRVDKLETELRDPKVRDEIEDRAVTGKRDRQVAAAVRAMDESREKAEAAAAREKERLLKAEVANIGKGTAHWDRIAKVFDLATDVLNAYIREADFLPEPRRFEVSITDTAIDNFTKAAEQVRSLLHPRRQAGGRGKVIDL